MHNYSFIGVRIRSCISLLRLTGWSCCVRQTAKKRFAKRSRRGLRIALCMLPRLSRMRGIFWRNCTKAGVCQNSCPVVAVFNESVSDIGRVPANSHVDDSPESIAAAARYWTKVNLAKPSASISPS
jgi:ferredoxin